MGLSADDVVNYPLKHAMRGYAVPQVDEFLDQIADELDRLHAEMAGLRAEVDAQRNRADEAIARLEETSDAEGAFRRVLTTAERAAEQAVEEARAEARQTVEDARDEASRLVEQARREAQAQREQRLAELDAQEARYRVRLRDLVAEIDRLKDYEADARRLLRGLLEDQLAGLEAAPVVAATPSPLLDEAPLGDVAVPAEPVMPNVQAQPEGTAADVPDAGATRAGATGADAEVGHTPPGSGTGDGEPEVVAGEDTVADDVVDDFLAQALGEAGQVLGDAGQVLGDEAAEAGVTAPDAADEGSTPTRARRSVRGDAGVPVILDETTDVLLLGDDPAFGDADDVDEVAPESSEVATGGEVDGAEQGTRRRRQGP